MRTCITPCGNFRFGVHRPSYCVANLRTLDHIEALGRTLTDEIVDNRDNFPNQDVSVDRASVIYEIPNPFAFRGTTYIDSSWADPKAVAPLSIALPSAENNSLSQALEACEGWNARAGRADKRRLFSALPKGVLLAVATTSTDPEDLRIIAELSCDLLFKDSDAQTAPAPIGLRYAQESSGRVRPVVHRHDLFEAVANNPWLPDAYKIAMVLRPGAQGASKIVGDVRSGPDGRTHVFEYLRQNSYIPWGHYAANMADDAVRYTVRELDEKDISALRHLYYQRTYVRLAEQCGLASPRRRMLLPDELEALRISVLDHLRRVVDEDRDFGLAATLWGWNFGFDCAPSGYRLHASHQQIHQQYALIPTSIPGVASHGEPVGAGQTFRPFACGDLVADAVAHYRAETGQGLFTDYLQAIRSNTRTDGRTGNASLVVHEDEQVLLFVPKAQATGFELQLMPRCPVGNILEADAACRASLDTAMLVAHRALEGLGARMVTSIEYSRRLGSGDPDQRLLYAFQPKLPYAPGGFSEAQARCIVGHYPEDFALACRTVLERRT